VELTPPPHDEGDRAKKGRHDHHASHHPCHAAIIIFFDRLVKAMMESPYAHTVPEHGHHAWTMLKDGKTLMPPHRLPGQGRERS
jgi:hypothetical protein